MKNVLIIYTLLLLMLLLHGCGPHRVDLSGSIEHKVNVSFEDIILYFSVVCDNDATCVNDSLLDFFNIITKESLQ